jgi:hypothetical protein
MQENKPGRRRALNAWKKGQLDALDMVHLGYGTISVSAVHPHDAVNSLICQGCGKEFKTLNTLTRHTRKSCHVNTRTNADKNR